MMNKDTYCDNGVVTCDWHCCHYLYCI